MPESVLTQTVPAVLAGGGGFEGLLVVEVDAVLLDALEVLDELDGAAELAGADAAVGVGLGAGAEFEFAAGVEDAGDEDAGVEADSLESLFLERLFFLVAPESAAELSAA
jgi:hypothetical protein